MGQASACEGQMFICSQQRVSPHASGGTSCRSVTQSGAGVSRNVWLLWEPADPRVNREVSYGERETRGGWAGAGGGGGCVVGVGLGMNG